MHIADVPPAYCSGCFQSKPDQRHVDFDVAWDGPVVQDGVRTGDGQTVHTVPVSIDDLILCEDCLRAAAAHVGLADPGELAAELEQLQDANRVLAEKVRGLEDYNTKLGAAVAAKPAQQQRRKAPAGVS